MSKFGEPQPCRNNCGAYIYFDKDSAVGHPSADKWLPLEYNHDSGIRTGQVHQCPKRSNGVRMQQQKQQQQQEQDNNPLAPVSDESVQRGISAISMMTDLIRLVEQTQKLLVSMDGKIDHLTKLVYAQHQEQQKNEIIS